MQAILKKLPLKEYFKASLILNFAVILFGLLIQGRLPPQIPIFYGLPQGEAQISSSFAILIPPVFSLVFICFNLFLTTVVKDEFIKKTLVVAGFATSVFASITIIKIIFLVGYI